MVEAALCNDAYDEIGLRALTKVKERHTKKVAAMPRASMCIIDLGKTTESLVEGEQHHTDTNPELMII